MSDFSRLSVQGTDCLREGNFPFHKTHIHRARKAEPDAVPTFFWPVAMLLLSVSVALICWGAYNALPQMAVGAEKHLRQAQFSPKFNPTSAEAPEFETPELLPEPELEELAVVANGTVEPPLLPPPSAVEIPAPSPLAVEPPPALPKVDLPLVLTPALPPPPPDPVPLLPQLPPPMEIQPANLAPVAPPVIPVQVVDTNPLVFRESTSGDTPMLRNWKTLALCSLMTTVFVQVPAPLVAGEKKEEKTLSERIDSLKDTIKTSFEELKGDLGKIRDDIKVVQEDGIKQRLALAAANAKIKQIDAALDKIRADLDALGSREPAPGRSGFDKASVEEIKSKLGSIEQAILKLQPATSRIALSPPPNSSLTGRVMLVNLYPEELLFVINQKNYRVAPGASLPLDNVPAGAVSYEVISGTWGLRARNTTPLAPNETFTLTAR